MNTKNIIISILSLAIGGLFGWTLFKKGLLCMVNDKEYVKIKIYPMVEKKIGKDKLERINKILEE